LIRFTKHYQPRNRRKKYPFNGDKNNMSSSESQMNEDKQSLNQWREVVESVASFATSGGGVVRIGISPKGMRVGVEIGRGTLEDLANKIKLNTDPPQYPFITVDNREDSHVVSIHVEESPIKPVWAFGKPLKRVGKTNQHISREETQRLMETTTGRTWDALPCREFSLDDIESEYIKDFLQRAELKQTPVQMLLKNMALVTSEDTPCNAAVLLFANNPQQFFPEAQVKCARFSGTTSVKFLDEKTFAGNIINQLDNALAFVARNTRQEISITGKAARDIIPEYPEEAVREAIINAICHRDYAAVGTVQVRLYDDRLEVWNPGSLPSDLPIERLYTEHPSRPHNPRIAQALYRARLIEHWGTGTLRMISVCTKSGIKLEFQSEAGVFMTRFLKLTQKGQPAIERELNVRQQKALAYVRKHGNLARSDYERICGVGKRQSVIDLNDLVGKGLLKKTGSGKSTRYVLTDRAE